MKAKFLGPVCGLSLLVSLPALGGSVALSESAGPALTTTDQPRVTGSFNVGYETLHVYRGADASAGDPIVWESLDIDAFNFVHLNLYNGNSFSGDYGELTPSIYFYKDLGLVTAAVGMIWYHFPGEHGIDSEEYFVRLSRNLGAGFAASTWFSYNARSEGWYHELKLTHSLQLRQRMKLETYGSLGISEDYRSGGDGLDNFTLAVGVPISLNDAVTLRPALGHAFALDALDTGDESWAALTLSCRF